MVESGLSVDGLLVC